MLIKKASKYHCLALFLQGLLKKRWAPNKPSLHPRPAVGVHLPHLVPDLLREQPSAPLLLVPQHTGFPDAATSSILWEQINVCKFCLHQG